jgi:hypothetical protein
VQKTHAEGIFYRTLTQLNISMTIKTSLRNLPRVRTARREPRTPDLPIPTVIQLADGREFNVHDLMAARTTPERYNLLTSGKPIPKRMQYNLKYSKADVTWMTQSSIYVIQERYGISLGYARLLKWKSAKGLLPTQD